MEYVRGLITEHSECNLCNELEQEHGHSAEWRVNAMGAVEAKNKLLHEEQGKEQAVYNRAHKASENKKLGQKSQCSNAAQSYLPNA